MTVATHFMSWFAKEEAQVPAAEASVAPAAEPTASRLAAAVGRGDEAAFRLLYERYQPRLFRLALMLGRGDEPLAQDVVQLVFVTAAKKLRHAESEEHLWNWLARVARQQVAKNRRRQRQDAAVINVAQLPECADNAATDATLEKCLDAALTQMAAEDQELVKLFYFERLSHKEIGERLELTPKAVSSRLERVREKLRRLVVQTLSHEA